jgi:hypothetical protein
MTQRSTALTRHEKFMAVIDGLAMSGGLDPMAHAWQIHESWTRAKGEHFARLGVLAADIPPSAEERSEILRALGERAARARAS